MTKPKGNSYGIYSEGDLELFLASFKQLLKKPPIKKNITITIPSEAFANIIHQNVCATVDKLDLPDASVHIHLIIEGRNQQ